MTTTILILAAVAPVITAIAAVGAFLQSRKNAKAILLVHLEINSRLDKWRAETKQASFAEGEKAQRDKQING